MAKWEPIFWIFALGLGWFFLLLFLESLKGNGKRKRLEGDSGADG